MKAVFAVLICLGCPGQEAFDEDYSEYYCALLSECEVLNFYGYGNVRECKETASATDDNCNFEDEKAEKCLEGIEAAGCQDLWDKSLPKACEQVCT